MTATIRQAAQAHAAALAAIHATAFPPAEAWGADAISLQLALPGAFGLIDERGGTAVFLEVATGNTAARALYKKFEYIEVGRRRRYYADGSDAVVLRMNLL